MSEPNKIPVNSYVKLKEGFDEIDLYRNVSAGATGWVRECKIDDGFAMIFIEWDETNPKYAGEIDKWAFENHFEVLSVKHDRDALAPERYIESIRIATDAALGADGFIMVAVHKKTAANGVNLYEPAIFSGELNDEASYILEAQIAYMASTMFQEYIQDTLNALKIHNKTEKDDKNESGR